MTAANFTLPAHVISAVNKCILSTSVEQVESKYRRYRTHKHTNYIENLAGHVIYYGQDCLFDCTFARRTLQLYFINETETRRSFSFRLALCQRHTDPIYCVLRGLFSFLSFHFAHLVGCSELSSSHLLCLFYAVHCAHFSRIGRIACVMTCCSIVWRNWIIYQPLKSWEPFTSTSFRWVRVATREHNSYHCRWRKSSAVRSPSREIGIFCGSIIVISVYVADKSLAIVVSLHLGAVHTRNAERHSISSCSRRVLGFISLSSLPPFRWLMEPFRLEPNKGN